MSDVIFIAGYYRSGTSALSGALAGLGVNILNDAEANEHNPNGSISFVIPGPSPPANTAKTDFRAPMCCCCG